VKKEMIALPPTIMDRADTVVQPNSANSRSPTGKFMGLSRGMLLTFVIAVMAGQIVKFPVLSIMGIMVISIMLGIGWKSVMDVPANASAGIAFSSKILLRGGIILMGLRLNLQQIIDAGTSVVLTDFIVVAFGLTVMIALGKLFRADKHVTALIAAGTAICGAAAIVTVAPLIGAKKEDTALSVACIAILGTIGTIIYIILYPVMALSPRDYGILTGSTLQELAHVIAAAVPGGEEGIRIAILVKLGRVALLIPAAFALGFLYNSRQTTGKTAKKRLKELPIPWFIFGFLAMCLVNTTGLLPSEVTKWLIALSVFLLSMAMAGLGLNINVGDFKKLGMRAVGVSIIGFIVLTGLGRLLVAVL
jgi:uncharacterized integral membrane protein (TIGR00698 family)